MKAITLTGPQQTQAAANKAALATAQAAYVAAQQTATSYLRSIAAAGSPPAPTNSRVQLSDDGTMIFIG